MNFRKTNFRKIRYGTVPIVFTFPENFEPYLPVLADLSAMTVTVSGILLKLIICRHDINTLKQYFKITKYLLQQITV